MKKEKTGISLILVKLLLRDAFEPATSRLRRSHSSHSNTHSYRSPLLTKNKAENRCYQTFIATSRDDSKTASKLIKRFYLGVRLEKQ